MLEVDVFRVMRPESSYIPPPPLGYSTYTTSPAPLTQPLLPITQPPQPMQPSPAHPIMASYLIHLLH
ncbi:hypothetical protein Pmani_029310 [Petrolisthes manimaculis]|uniref:Uncharacterized protein n=1 Tax=Petrolisthes manimaculis TaxID=1843537 RepID=A0AAE1TX52_9EUCA|nr:hypothetical protein Pmani_029310 [Petrolisthes manimaculis]